MQMVGHETPGPYGDAVFPAPLGQKIDVRQAVIIAKESSLPAISPLCDMMGNTRTYNLRHSCHGLMVESITDA